MGIRQNTEGHAVDGRNSAAPKKPSNDEPPYKYQQTIWFQPYGFIPWCEKRTSTHPISGPEVPLGWPETKVEGPRQAPVGNGSGSALDGWLSMVFWFPSRTRASTPPNANHQVGVKKDIKEGGGVPFGFP